MKNVLRLGLVFSSILLGLVAVGLVTSATLLATPAHAGSSAFHCVNAGEKIQDAIDAADPGDTVAVITTTVFTENLVISKSLTLSGGWSEDCVHQSDAHLTIVNANSAGRGITINGTGGGMKVILRKLDIVNGDATGLGGATIESSTLITLPQSGGWEPGVTITQTLADAAQIIPSNWKDRLAELNASGKLPGGQETYQGLVDRIEGLLNPQDAPYASLDFPIGSDLPPQTPAKSKDADCGGAIYVDNAALELDDVLVGMNVASTADVGYGGGLCGVNLPEDGVSLHGDTQFIHNVGSTAADGAGGAIFINGGDLASVIISEGLVLDANIASRNGRGSGGGAAILHSPDVQIDKPIMMWNLAGRSTEMNPQNPGTSLGGALYLEDCPDAQISEGTYLDNIADAGGFSGVGGGITIYESQNVTVTGNFLGRNTAHANTGLLGPDGVGGGLALVKSPNAYLTSNTFEFNVGSLYAQGYGGGLYAWQTDAAVIEENNFFDNQAAFFPNGAQFGGGIFGVEIDHLTIANNIFRRNMVGMWSPRDFLGFGPSGGGLALDSVTEALVQNNTFEANTGLLAGIGHGAGMSVGGKSSNINIFDNTFRKNVSVRQDLEGDPPSIGEGAGVTIDMASDVNIVHNTFENNAGSLGSYKGSVIVSSGFIPGSEELGSTNILIDANKILNSGRDLLVEGPVETGAIYESLTEYITITNNILAGNNGYGINLIFDDPDPDQQTHALVANNTLANNEGTGMEFGENWSDDFLRVTNNILTGHEIGMDCNSDNTVTVDRNLVYSNTTNFSGNLTDTQTIIADPQFMDPNNMDFHFKWWASPARDAGVGIPPAPSHDADGVTRPFGPAVDIGAYEFHNWLYFFSLVGN